MPNKKPIDVAERLRNLRARLDLTQAQVVQGVMTADVLSSFENGRNKASTYKARNRLARGYRVSLTIIAGYIDGLATVEDVVLASAWRKQ